LTLLRLFSPRIFCDRFSRRLSPFLQPFSRTPVGAPENPSLHVNPSANLLPFSRPLLRLFLPGGFWGWSPGKRFPPFSSFLLAYFFLGFSAMCASLFPPLYPLMFSSHHPPPFVVYRPRRFLIFFLLFCTPSLKGLVRVFVLYFLPRPRFLPPSLRTKVFPPHSIFFPPPVILVLFFPNSSSCPPPLFASSIDFPFFMHSPPVALTFEKRNLPHGPFPLPASSFVFFSCNPIPPLPRGSSSPRLSVPLVRFPGIFPPGLAHPFSRRSSFVLPPVVRSSFSFPFCWGKLFLKAFPPTALFSVVVPLLSVAV